MTFRYIVYSALLVGLATGLLLTALQQFQVDPLILAAEQYEVAEQPAVHQHSLAMNETNAEEHHHDEQAWAPADGAERLFFTALANVLTALGFALVMLALMAVKPVRNLAQGLLWGLAGYLTFFVAPALGLHPEIPGMQAAALESRQLWWAFTALMTASGLAVLAFAPARLKAFSLILLALPHIWGAPHLLHEGFTNPDPNAVAILQGLASKFIQATALTNGIYWLAIGLLSALAARRFLKAEQSF